MTIDIAKLREWTRSPFFDPEVAGPKEELTALLDAVEAARRLPFDAFELREKLDCCDFENPDIA